MSAHGAQAPLGECECWSSDDGFTVMTYNVGNGLAVPRRLAAALRMSDADIIGLQEVTSDQATAIARHLATRYPYQALYGEGIPGKAVLSRYPIAEVGRLWLDPDRPDVRAIIDLRGRALTVIVAHPAPPRRNRYGWTMTPTTRAHLNALTASATTGDPTVLLGDFNLTALHAPHRALRAAGLTDAFREVGRGFGHTHPRSLGGMAMVPFLRIDYIWYTRHLVATQAWTGAHGGSDHIPVLARLQWR